MFLHSFILQKLATHTFGVHTVVGLFPLSTTVHRRHVRQRVHPPQRQEKQACPETVRWLPHLSLSGPPYVPHHVGHPSAQKTKIHPRRCHHLLLQYLLPHPLLIQLSGDHLLPQPQLPDRNLLRQTQRLCNLQEPANNILHRNPAGVPGPQGHQHLVTVYFRHQCSGGALQRRVVGSGTVQRWYQSADQGERTGEMESRQVYLRPVSYPRQLRCVYSVREQADFADSGDCCRYRN